MYFFPEKSFVYITLQFVTQNNQSELFFLQNPEIFKTTKIMKSKMKSRAILNVKKVELFQILTDYDTQKQLVCLNSNVNFMCHNLLKYLRGFVQKIF